MLDPVAVNASIDPYMGGGIIHICISVEPLPLDWEDILKHQNINISLGSVSNLCL